MLNSLICSGGHCMVLLAYTIICYLIKLYFILKLIPYIKTCFVIQQLIAKKKTIIQLYYQTIASAEKIR